MAVTQEAGSSSRAAVDSRVRLHGLSVGNLKSFVGNHNIPLAPLTLIYGPNSAGKSSLVSAPGRLLVYLVLSPFGSQGMWPVRDRNEWARLVKDWRREISGHSDALDLTLGATFVGHWSSELNHVALTVSLVKPNPKTLKITLTSRIGGGPTATRDALSLAGQKIVVESTGDVEAAYGFNPNEFEGGEDGDAADLGLMDVLLGVRALGAHRGDPKKLLKFFPSYKWLKSGNADYRTYFAEPDAHINEWFADLSIPYVVERKVTRTPSGTWFQRGSRAGEARWNLTDLRSGLPVGLEDVGYGVSQLLPIVDALSAPDGSVVTIQEPESHLHPKLQSSLGELLVDAVNHGKQIIAETHSENILLRVQRLIREGRITPAQVAVLYVDRSEESSWVRQLRLGANGELLDPWPTGFFDDSLDDLLGGWQ